eukprot:11993548-Heterocapsa_arctica.AAC.1
MPARRGGADLHGPLKMFTHVAAATSAFQGGQTRQGTDEPRRLLVMGRSTHTCRHRPMPRHRSCTDGAEGAA